MGKKTMVKETVCAVKVGIINVEEGKKFGFDFVSQLIYIFSNEYNQLSEPKLPFFKKSTLFFV